MKKMIIFITLLNALIFTNCVYGSVNKEDDNKEISNSDENQTVPDSVQLPEFINDNRYIYNSETFGSQIWHTFLIEQPNSKVGTSNLFYSKMNEIIPGVTTVSSLTEVLGLPDKVVIAQVKNDFYLNLYYEEVHLFINISNDILNEIRFESETSYRYQDYITVGTGLDDVLGLLPYKSVVEGESIISDQDSVLYKNINGEEGRHYIDYIDKKIRLFFADNAVCALYLY